MRSVKHRALFTLAEDQLLRERALRAGLSIAELLRSSALGKPLPIRPPAPSPIASAQWVELSGLASNLNQLQRDVNRGQRDAVPFALVEEVRWLLRQVRAALLGLEP